MNSDQQRTRVVILSLSGLLLAASAGVWVIYKNGSGQQVDEVANYHPADGKSVKPAVNLTGPIASAPAPTVALAGGPGMPAPPLVPPSVVRAAVPTTQAVPINISTPLPAKNIGASSVLPPPKMVTQSSSLPPKPTGEGTQSVAPSSPDKTQTLTNSPSPSAAPTASVNAELAQRAVDMYKKRKRSELFSFLFENGPPPLTESPPTQKVSGSGRLVYPATSRLQAMADARKSLAMVQDPFSLIPTSEFKPFGPRVPKSAVDWKLVLMDKNSPSNPKAPNPSFPEPPAEMLALVPPPPPSPPSGSGLSIEQLPPPPDKPAASIDDVHLLAVMDGSVIVRTPKKIHLVINVGESYEGLTLTGAGGLEATFNDGYRSYTKTL